MGFLDLPRYSYLLDSTKHRRKYFILASYRLRVIPSKKTLLLRIRTVRGYVMKFGHGRYYTVLTARCPGIATYQENRPITGLPFRAPNKIAESSSKLILASTFPIGTSAGHVSQVLELISSVEESQDTTTSLSPNLGPGSAPSSSGRIQLHRYALDSSGNYL